MLPNRKRRSNRRSSILKGGSPRDVLSEVDNIPDETTTIRKSRRVSFASHYMVKEFIKDSPKVPVVDNTDVPSVSGLQDNSILTASNPVVNNLGPNANQTQWGDISMEMTETIPAGVAEGPRFTADPSPIAKVDSQSLLQRISILKGNFAPRNLNEHGIRPQPTNSSESMNITTAEAYNMELTQCVGSGRDISIFPDPISRSGKGGLVEKTMIFQDENTCDMSVTMCQPPLNMSTMAAAMNQPQSSNPVLVTRSLLSKLSAVKKTVNNPAWGDKTRLHNTGDNSALMELTCFPNASICPNDMAGTSENVDISPQSEDQPVYGAPNLRPNYISASNPGESENKCISGPGTLSQIKTGQSVSEMDITCTRDESGDKRVSFSPIISTAFELNDTTSTVSSEQVAPNESLRNDRAQVGQSVHQNVPLPGVVANSLSIGNDINKENQENVVSQEPCPPRKLVTSSFLSKLSAGSSKPKNLFASSVLLSKLSGSGNKTTPFNFGNDTEKTKVNDNTGFLSAKPTGLSNKTTLFSSETDMEETGVIPSEMTGVTNKTTIFSSENDMDMTGVIPSKLTSAANKTTVFGTGHDMEMTKVCGLDATQIDKTTVFSSENDMEMTGVLLSKPTGARNMSMMLPSGNQDVDRTRELPPNPNVMSNKTLIFGFEDGMEITGVIPLEQTAVSNKLDMTKADGDKSLLSKPTGISNRTVMFGSENEMDMTNVVNKTGILTSKPTGYPDRTTIFSQENDMDMTKVDSDKSILPKPTGIPNRTVMFGSENEMDMTNVVNKTGILTSKPTGLPGKTTVFSSENDMDMMKVDSDKSILPKPTGIPNRTVMFASENEMDMTNVVNKTGILTSKPTGLPDRTTVFSSENDMDITGIIPIKQTGASNKTTVFSVENDMEMTRVEGNTATLTSKPTGLSNRTTFFSSENEMEMTSVLPAKPTNHQNKTTVFSAGDDMETTQVGSANISITNITRHNATSNIELSHSEKTNGDLSAKPSKSNNIITEGPENGANISEIQLNKTAVATSVVISETEMELSVLSKQSTASSKGCDITQGDIVNHSNDLKNDTGDSEVTFKLPPGSEEAFLSLSVYAKSLHEDLQQESGVNGDNEDMGPQSELANGVDIEKTNQAPEIYEDLQTSRKSLEKSVVNDAAITAARTGAGEEYDIMDVSLELVDLTGDQQSNFMKSSTTLPDEVRSMHMSMKNSTTNSVSHFSDLGDASSIMRKTTQGVSFSVIDDISMATEITTFDDFLSIFQIILYDPVVRGNSLCPPQVEDNDSLGEKLKVMYCMKPELELIEAGNEQLLALLSEHDNVFRAKEAAILPDLVLAIKDEDIKKKIQAFIQKVQQNCYEQAQCDVKRIRLDMAQEMKGTLKEKSDQLEKDIKILRNIPVKLQTFSEDINHLKEVANCLDDLKEVKTRAEKLEEKVTNSTEKEQELQAKIEFLKAQLELMPSPGKPTRDLKNKLFRLRESVPWKLLEFGPHGSVFSFLDNLVHLKLKFGEKLSNYSNHRTVVGKSLQCNLGASARCSDSLSANLMAKSSVLQTIDCGTTKLVPKLLDALSEIAHGVQVIRKELAKIEWFHDVSIEDNCGLMFSISEYKTVCKLKLVLKFDPDHPDSVPQMLVQPIFGNIREEQLLTHLKGVPAGSGLLKRITGTVETHLSQCTSLMEVGH